MATQCNRHARSARDILKSLAVALLFGAATTVHAQAITLDFEGLQNQEYVENFYNGGTGSEGSSGTNYGVEFGDDLLAFIGGNYANPPSPDTILVPAERETTINVAAGFSGLLSLFYTSANSVTIRIYDQVDGNGNLLASGTFPQQNDDGGCTGAGFCNWTLVSIPFSGSARSISLDAPPYQSGFDNISLGTRTDQLAPIPSLSFLATLLLATALGALTFASKRRRSV